LRRLCFSLGIQDLVPAVPRKSLCPTPAPYTPAAAHPVFRLPTDHLPRVVPGTFLPTLTTTALYRSSSDRFETRS
jgi:hypothetical protein